MRAERGATPAAAFVALLGWSVWAEEPGPTQPWEAPSEAGGLYWLLVALVALGLLAFSFWALYGRVGLKRFTTTGYHALGALVIVLTLFTLVLYLIPATQAMRLAPTQRAWDWKPGEVLNDPGGSGLAGEPYRGYLVYLANGCTYCHTLYLRPQDIGTGWGEGAAPDDVSRMGDYANYPFTMLGTQRDGPDLTIIGRRIPDMSYQIEHLKEPRRFKPRSIMPSYRYLPERDLLDLAAFLVSLGNEPEKLRAGKLIEKPEGLSELAQQGQKLYRKLRCVGCHTTDGSPNVGPTWLGLWGSERTLEDGAVVVADEEYLEESIRTPAAKIVRGFRNVMPPFARLSAEEIQALIEFIKSLSETESK